jgi:CheY-like chemotaxis protein
MQLLLVEDNPELCASIAAAVATASWRCQSVHTRADSIAVAASTRFHIIVLYNNSLGGDGLWSVLVLCTMSETPPGVNARRIRQQDLSSRRAFRPRVLLMDSALDRPLSYRRAERRTCLEQLHTEDKLI